MVAEFMHEQVIGPVVVGCGRAELAEDAATAVGVVVDEDFDEFIRRILRQVAQGAVVRRQHITLAAENIVARAQRRRMVHARRWTRHARFLRRRGHGPHIEVIGPLAKWRHRKQVFGQFARRRFELAHFGGRIAVAHDQQVDLPGRGATDADRYRLDGCRRLLADHVLRGRVDIGTPHNGKQAALVALEDAHAHGVLGLRETHGFLERARGGFRFVGTGPFTENGGEAARIQHLARLDIDHFQQVVATVAVIDGARQVARPWQGLDQHALDRIMLAQRIAAVLVIEAHGGRLGGTGSVRDRDDAGGQRQRAEEGSNRGLLHFIPDTVEKRVKEAVFQTNSGASGGHGKIRCGTL